MYKDITLEEKLSKQAKKLHVELEYNNGKPASGKMPSKPKKKTEFFYWLIDEQDHSSDHYGIVDALEDGCLFNADGKVNTETLRLYPFSVIESVYDSVTDIEEKFEIDYDYCLISKKQAKALIKARDKDFESDSHWETLEEWSLDQREEDKDED